MKKYNDTKDKKTSIKIENQQNSEVIKLPRIMLLIGFFVLVTLVIFVVVHFTEVEQFALLLSKAEPKWLFLAVLLQIGTYLCAGFIWNQVIRSAQHRVPLGALARLSVEKLSIDQLLPTGGISGNLVVLQIMRRLGLPNWLAMEAMLVDILSHYTAYAIVTFLALSILWFYHDITNIICYLVSIFAVILVIVPITILWLLTHRNNQPPLWLLRFHPIAKASEVIKSVSPDRVLSPTLLITTSLLSMTIFLLDAGTLWTMMRVINSSVGIMTTFVAIVIASIAGTISFLPGGIGGFEAGSVTVLTLLGVPIEAALTGTLLLRGFTLWFPLIPGILLVRHDINIRL